MQRRLLRHCLTPLLIIVTILTCADPASAHQGDGVRYSNFHTRIFRTTPEANGVSVAVKNNGDQIQFINSSRDEITILDYDGAPYLRVGPNGAFENSRSPACASNASRFAPAPTSQDIRGAPEEPLWRRIRDRPYVAWHDHRIHWPTPELPQVVRDSPNTTHVLFPEWRIEFLQNNQSYVVTGDLRWVPAASWKPWFAGGMITAVILACALAFLNTTHRRYLLLVVVLVMLSLHIAHAMYVAMGSLGMTGEHIAAFFSKNYAMMFAWLAGLIGIMQFRRHATTAHFLLLFFALSVFIVNGIGDLNAFGASQINAATSITQARLSTTVSIIGGCAVCVGVIRNLREQFVHA